MRTTSFNYNIEGQKYNVTVENPRIQFFTSSKPCPSHHKDFYQQLTKVIKESKSNPEGLSKPIRISCDHPMGARGIACSNAVRIVGIRHLGQEMVEE